MVVQNATSGARKLCLQIMLPPQGVGIDGKADIVTLAKLVENIQRLDRKSVV